MEEIVFCIVQDYIKADESGNLTFMKNAGYYYLFNLNNMVKLKYIIINKTGSRALRMPVVLAGSSVSLNLQLRNELMSCPHGTLRL